MELVLVVDAAADDLDDFLRQFVLFLFVGLYQLHSETLLDAGEVEILPFQTPLAGADVVEHIRHLLAILKGGDIDLPGGVEGGAVGVEVHRAGLVHVEVRAFEVIVEGVCIVVVSFNLRRFAIGFRFIFPPILINGVHEVVIHTQRITYPSVIIPIKVGFPAEIIIFLARDKQPAPAIQPFGLWNPKVAPVAGERVVCDKINPFASILVVAIPVCNNHHSIVINTVIMHQIAIT